MPYSHRSVLLDEVIHYLRPRAGGRYIDCTLGGGGHTLKILERSVPGGQVLAIDLDPQALEAAARTIGSTKRVTFVQENFKNLKQITKHVQGFNQVDGILLDLGLSSGQLQDQFRGFSFLAEGRLDMRFGAQTDITAEQIVNQYPPQRLYEIFKIFGEERLAKPIAQRIFEVRKHTPITSPRQMVDIVTDVYHRHYRKRSKVNPATKVFQALRIAVNEELENLRQLLPDAIDLLKPDGRIAVMSYHSLEDRIVKQFFKSQATTQHNIARPELPQASKKAVLRLITKKPVVPTDAEIIDNPRTRSAKLRVASKNFFSG